MDLHKDDVTSAEHRAPAAGAATGNWWERPFRLVQTNLRMKDINLDPQRLAQQLEEFGASAVLFNVGGIYAWYPTELELHTRNPMLGDNDPVAEMIDAVHARGIRFCARIDPSKSTRATYERHPEWFVHNRAGKPLEYNGTYLACVNGGWYGIYLRQILREAFTRYEVDGVYFNMFGYRSTDYSGRYHGICCCRNCEERFRAFSGKSLPVVENFSDPAWRDYLRFQEVTTDELHKSVYDTVKQISPKTGVMGRKWGCDFLRLETQRAVDRPQPEWAQMAGEHAKLARSMGRGMNHCSASTNFFDYAWRFVSESPACNMLRFAQQLAGGASFDYYVLGTFDQDDRKAATTVASLYNWHRKNQEHYRDLTSGTSVGLYNSRRSQLLQGRPVTEAFRGAYLALSEARVPFDIVSDTRAAFDDFGEHLADYEVILMPGIECLGDSEAAALDAWVKAGGTLIATGPTGLLDETAAKRDRYALASLPVDKLVMLRDGMRGSYFRIAPDEFDLPDTQLTYLDGTYWHATLKDGAEGALRLIPPQKFGPPEHCYPEVESDLPGVVSMQYGAGNAIYLPWQPDRLYYRDGSVEHREILAQLIRRHHHQPVRLEGAGRVEFTVQQQAGTDRRLVHLVNFSGQNNGAYMEPSAIHGLRLGLAGKAPTSVRSLVSEKSLEVGPADGDGYRWIDVPPLGYFDAIQIDG